MSSILTGTEFNEKYHLLCEQFVKLTNDSENHNGFQFRTGLNVDPVPFNPRGKCQSGGIYFCEFSKFPRWLNYDNRPMYYMRSVRIPDDARVYEEKNKWKADRIILGERIPISELEIWNNSKDCSEAVKVNGYALKYIKDQTLELCAAAVKKNGDVLQYVRDQNEEVCLEAVKQNGYSLFYVKNKTPEICLEAVKRRGCALAWIINPTQEMCWEAVKQSGYALQYVKDQTVEICLMGVRRDGHALRDVWNQTEEICSAAVQQDGLALAYVKNQTPAICMIAVYQDSRALQYVKEEFMYFFWDNKEGITYNE